MAGRDFISPRLRSSNECLTYENGASFFSPSLRSPALSLSLSLSLSHPVTIITAPCFLDVRGVSLVAHHPFVLRQSFPSVLSDRTVLSRAFSRIPFSFAFYFPAFFSRSRFSPYARFHSRSLSICRPQVAAINAKTTRRSRALPFYPVTAPKNPLSR